LINKTWVKDKLNERRRLVFDFPAFFFLNFSALKEGKIQFV